jgi:hypothetical protein
VPVSEPSAADAEAQLVEIFAHCWCDRNEALWQSVLFAARAHDEREAITQRRARGEHDPAWWDEVLRLNAWCWLARESAGRKLPAASGLHGSR